MAKRIHIYVAGGQIQPKPRKAKDATAEQKAKVLKQRMDAIEKKFNASKDPNERKLLMRQYADLQEQRRPMLVYPSKFDDARDASSKAENIAYVQSKIQAANNELARGRLDPGSHSKEIEKLEKELTRLKGMKDAKFKKYDTVSFKFENRVLSGEVRGVEGSSYKIYRPANGVTYQIPEADISLNQRIGGKDADYSARHRGNFMFVVTAPDGKTTEVKADTSEEAITKAKKLPATAWKSRDAAPGRLLDTITDGNATVKVYYDSGNQEYCNRLFVDGKDQGEGPAYYTDDKSDAMSTAKDMAKRAKTK